MTFLKLFQVTLHGGEGGQVVTQHVHGVPVVQEVPIPAHRPLPDPLETQLGKFSQSSDHSKMSILVLAPDRGQTRLWFSRQFWHHQSVHPV